MAAPDENKVVDFTVFLEGHEGHQGNVLGRAYISKLSKLLNLLAKLERTFLDGSKKKTDFEIVATEKYNPTTITFKPVPSASNYNPRPAFEWGLEQIGKVGRGEAPDQKLKSPIVKDMAELSKESTDSSYKTFWINGHAEPIRFDENYHINALALAKKMAQEEAPIGWYVGVSKGEVVGRLMKFDDLDADHEFFIVPPIGADKVRCKFPRSMEDEIGDFLYKMVRVTGDIHYSEMSPHPDRVVLYKGGISLIEDRRSSGSLRDLRGIFRGARKKPLNLENIVGA